MCRRPAMESYQEFCLKSVAILQQGEEFKEIGREPLCSPKARSFILFNGRAVLLPLLSAEQRSEMCEYRRRAAQLEERRESRRRNGLLAEVQGKLDQVQVYALPNEEVVKQPASPCQSINYETVNGYTLVTDSPGLPRDSGFEVRTSDLCAAPCAEPLNLSLNGFRKEEVEVEREEKSEEEQEEDEEEEAVDISLDSLLKRSREYVKREQNQTGSKVTNMVPQTPPPDTLSEKENKSWSPSGNTGIEFGFSLHHSPIGSPPQTKNQLQVLYDQSTHQPGCISPSLPDQYARGLPIPATTVTARAPSRRPRPVSAGNIHISFPIDPEDLIPRSPCRSEEVDGGTAWGEAFSGARRCSYQWGFVGSGDEDGSSNCRSNHCGTSPVHSICSPASVSGPSLMGHHEQLTLGFRRRCHTLDSQLHTFQSGVEHIDRSQERVPRFMAGVTRLAPSRRSPTVPMNQSYDVESPSASLLRPHVNPDLSQVKFRMEPDDHHGPNNGRITPTALRNVTEVQGSQAGETQSRAQALEDMQRRLEEEHALQMSLLLAEQEKEQHRLLLELEQTERSLKEKVCERPLSGGDAWGQSRRSVSDSCPVFSPTCPGLSPAHTPSEPSPGHTLGFHTQVSSSVSSPSVQPPVFLWGPNWGASKPRARMSLVLSEEQQRALSRIGAITRGFLTRRLLKTEKVRNLRQCVADTQEFIHSFQTEAPQRKGTCSAQDLSLQERVRAHLRAALYDIHDIFFEMPLEDRLALLQQDRELRAERKLRDMEKAKCLKERALLSAATQRSLDRKKRVLKPSQGQNTPLSGQLNRQGSWSRKNPEERVRRSDSLKKRYSVG
ncbi:centriolar coiled-coil protein of 110 kDa isoform X2 [Genypterus blacodes]|uniref:centriolar coiled-coil protein of 110 kDa isoform X2 n=1 Tax=Genypterus blacodes TaxID=154954 RepID=UPI003F77223C